jgi:deoxyhypusine synthase
MSKDKNLKHNSKKDFLKNPVEHIDITSFDSRPIISSMEKMSFVSRETANAANIFNDMIKDKECTIFLTLAGSTSAAGCMNLYSDLEMCDGWRK